MEKTTVQWLNLLHGSPDFVIREAEDGRARVSQMSIIPDNDGIYWVAGTTVIHREDRIPSVFVVDTSSGGELAGVYWKIADSWISSAEKDKAADALGAGTEDLFPFDWEFAVPLTRDIFHDEVH